MISWRNSQYFKDSGLSHSIWVNEGWIAVIDVPLVVGQYSDSRWMTIEDILATIESDIRPGTTFQVRNFNI
jgi:hypothetical protein